MVEQKQTYLGHERQLQHVADELRISARGNNTSRFFILAGPTGLGKRTFLQRLWQRLDPAGAPRILIFEKGQRGSDIADELVSGMDSNRSFLKKSIQQLQHQYQATLGRLQEGASEGLPPQAKLTLLRDLIEQFITEESSSAKNLQVLTFIANADTLSAALRQQLVTLASDLPGVDSRLFLTTNSEPGSELLGSIKAVLGEPENIQLPALTPEEVEIWLRMQGLPDSVAADVYKAANGLPGKLASAAQEIVSHNKARAELATAEKLLEALSFEQRLGVCAAAYLPELTEDSLRSLFSAEQADSVMQLIRRMPLETKTSRNGPIKIDPESQSALRRWLEHQQPSHATKARNTAGEFSKIAARIPDKDHRLMLSRLTGFNYLNQEVLEEILGPEAIGYPDFIHDNPEYFEVNGRNCRMLPEVKELIEAYCKLNQIKRPQDESTRIGAAWEKKRQDVLRASTLTEERINEQNEALDKILAQIRKLNREITAENETILKLRRKHSPAAAHGTDRRRNRGSVSSIALQVIGTGVLYFSILLSEKVSLTYAIVGVLFILAGLFLHGRRGMMHELPSRVQTPAADTSKQERNLHFLHLKRKQLETKHSLIAMNLSKQRSALKEFDRILREPYS